jgi:hypothetical protein
MLLASCVARADETVTTRDEVSVGTNVTVDVQSAGGAVQLEQGGAGKVRVEAERHASTKDEAQKLDVSVKKDGDTVRIVFKKKEGWSNTSVAFHIWAPDNSQLHLRTGGGAVRVEKFRSGADIETGGGSITTDKVHGHLLIVSGGGAIRAQGCDGTVEARTGGGSVDVSGRITGKSQVQSGGGSIEVAVPASAKLQVDASSGGGRVENDFGIPVSRGRFSGKLGDGSDGSLMMQTGGGHIALRKSS